jgi:hypothetical protein
MELDFSAPSVFAAFKEITFIDLSRNSAQSAETVILALIINLSIVLIESVVVGNNLNSKGVVEIDLTGDNEVINIDGSSSVPLLGASLVTIFIHVWQFRKHFFKLIQSILSFKDFGGSLRLR